MGSVWWQPRSSIHHNLGLVRVAQIYNCYFFSFQHSTLGRDFSVAAQYLLLIVRYHGNKISVFIWLHMWGLVRFSSTEKILEANRSPHSTEVYGILSFVSLSLALFCTVGCLFIYLFSALLMLCFQVNILLKKHVFCVYLAYFIHT